MLSSGMKRILHSLKRASTIILGALAMICVAVVCAFVSLRIAIHGREVVVPNLAGLSDADAASAAKDLGLNLSVENRFYSPTVPQNQVLSQLPVAGARVRRGWQVRITESLGPQQVSVPDVTGQTERPASLILRRLLLDVSSVAHLPAPPPVGIVLAQSPPANSKGMNGPRVSFLVSDNETTVDEPAYVMPSIVGLTVGTASLRLAGAGLHIGTSQTPEQTPDQTEPTPAETGAVPTGAATITSQSPLAGHKVTRADTIRVTLSY
jgi:beta-lactam-binding protein with PASTA domain